MLEQFSDNNYYLKYSDENRGVLSRSGVLMKKKYSSKTFFTNITSESI